MMAHITRLTHVDCKQCDKCALVSYIACDLWAVYVAMMTDCPIEDFEEERSSL
jgi:hypothetical protein